MMNEKVFLTVGVGEKASRASRRARPRLLCFKLQDGWMCGVAPPLVEKKKKRNVEDGWNSVI